MTTQFQVRKDQLATTRVVQLPDAPLAEGEVRVRIEHFAYTSNNITYAAFGDAMNYWQFFPVAPAAGDAAAWGVVPVWGFGVVEQTQCARRGRGRAAVRLLAHGLARGARTRAHLARGFL